MLMDVISKLEARGSEDMEVLVESAVLEARDLKAFVREDLAFFAGRTWDELSELPSCTLLVFWGGLSSVMVEAGSGISIVFDSV